MTKDDLISRQAAISHVDDVPYIKDHPNVGLLWKAWIESLPSAQPERIKGHWIDAVLPNDSGGLPVIVCDQCNTFSRYSLVTVIISALTAGQI